MAEDRAVAGLAGQHRFVGRLVGEHHHHSARVGQALSQVSGMVGDPVGGSTRQYDEALHVKLTDSGTSG